MEIGPLITRAVLTVEVDDSLRDAAVWMMERGVGSAVVLDDGKPVGIVTDRDSLRVVAQGADGKVVTVGDCLRGDWRPRSPRCVLDAAQLMREKNFRHLVVVDEEGALLGVFSMRDLVVGLLEERDAPAPE